jgi:hypothetical protein
MATHSQVLLDHVTVTVGMEHFRGPWKRDTTTLIRFNLVESVIVRSGKGGRIGSTNGFGLLTSARRLIDRTVSFLMV